jgi:hypothetical protein
VDEGRLRRIWNQIALNMLRLHELRFPRIGSLVQDPTDEGSITVSGRPLTFNTSEMINLAHIPTAAFPSKNTTYATSDEWYLALTNMHMAQLLFQHNDLTKEPDDCRNKFVARLLFRRLASQGKLHTCGFVDDNWSFQAFSHETEFPTCCQSAQPRLEIRHSGSGATTADQGTS